MSARRVRHEEEEEHENHERWLITYADMITLLMVLFIVLFSISQVDLAKFKQFKAGLNEFGNGESSLIELHEGGLLTEPQLATLTEAENALAEKQATTETVERERVTLQQAQAQITEQLRVAGLDQVARFRYEARGLIVTIVTDRVLFAPGSADLTPDGKAILDVVSDALAPLPNLLAVEGHTDAVPINTERFPSNWELSTARATSVLRALVTGHGIDADRLSAAGYADQRPLATNDSADGRAQNRRVEIVVRSTTSQDQEA
ncbi:MAG: flagellar motor protein MotB [Actinomycetota bacterium]|nr:flagellar motor protein MotB [Actinomycetota bacterium]